MTTESEFDFSDPFVPELVVYAKQEGVFPMSLETPPDSEMVFGALITTQDHAEPVREHLRSIIAPSVAVSSEFALPDLWAAWLMDQPVLEINHEGCTVFLTFSEGAEKIATLCDMYHDPGYGYIPDSILLLKYGLVE